MRIARAEMESRTWHCNLTLILIINNWITDTCVISYLDVTKETKNLDKLFYLPNIIASDYLFKDLFTHMCNTIV